MKNIHLLLGITIGFIFSLILQIAIFSPTEKHNDIPIQTDYKKEIEKVENKLLQKEMEVDSLSHDLEKLNEQNKLKLATINAQQQKLLSMAIQLKTDSSFSESEKIEKLSDINQEQFSLQTKKDSLFESSLSNYKGLYLLEKSLRKETMQGFLDCKLSIENMQSDNTRLYALNQKLESRLTRKKNTTRLLTGGVISFGVLSTLLILTR